MNLKIRYLTLLKKSLLDWIYGPRIYLVPPKDKSPHKTQKDMIIEGGYSAMHAKTMIGIKRLNNLEYCINEILKRNIEGDLLEAGVWRGGASIFMRAMLDINNNLDKKVYVSDSFCGFPYDNLTHEYDKIKYEEYPDNQKEFTSVSLDTVKDNFRRYDLLDDRVHFIEGYFEDTLPKHKDEIKKLALLRIDCDMYSSTMTVLDELYDSVSKGGYIIIDDYGLAPCRKAVNDFMAKRGLGQIQYRKIDYTGIFWIKE